MVSVIIDGLYAVCAVGGVYSLRLIVMVHNKDHDCLTLRTFGISRNTCDTEHISVKIDFTDEMLPYIRSTKLEESSDRFA